MVEENVQDAKSRIMQAASDLFAEFGYSAVGVREIAKKADVNISMISYYFKGKVGIMKEIIAEYFHELEQIIKATKAENLNSDDVLKLLIKRFTDLFTLKPSLCKVAITELPFNVPELLEYKKELIFQHLQFVKDSFSVCKHSNEDKLVHLIVGPAFFSLVFSNFYFGSIVKSAYNYEFDENFYDKYADIISTIFLNGIRGFADKMRASMMKEHGEMPPHGSHPHTHNPHGAHPHAAHPNAHPHEHSNVINHKGGECPHT